uniref:DUF4283 domain-containing protein n=1 Tax=Tanacetum cinerariifolium TaxID=118510 RepID=A0A6L2LGE8_TANCI|nr:hypothetical protein [Tanacetum cinerariifolium]
MDGQSLLVDQTNAGKTGGGSYLPLPTQGTTPAGNTPGNSSYANVIGESSKMVVNIYTLFTPGGIGLMLSYRWSRSELLAKVWVKLHGVPVTAFNEDSLSAIAMKLATSLMLDSYTSDMCLQSWGFKSHKEYIHVPKKPTASSNVNKKKGVEPTNEVSNKNPFEVLNSVDNDVELGTNEETTNLVNNRANLSGSSFMNVKNSSTSNTSIIDKIKEFGKAILVDEAGNPLKKVECLGDYDSEDEVASVDNNMTRSMASEREVVIPANKEINRAGEKRMRTLPDLTEDEKK